MKDLPIGMSHNTGRNKGYRLNRTVRNKEYNLGSFQNIEHALRTNGYIDVIVADLKEAHSKEGILSVDEIREMIVENSASDVAEITKLIEGLDSLNEYRKGFISEGIDRLHERLDKGMTINVPAENKSFWQRITGR